LFRQVEDGIAGQAGEAMVDVVGGHHRRSMASGAAPREDSGQSGISASTSLASSTSDSCQPR
jgi:hypothetical protein